MAFVLWRSFVRSSVCLFVRLSGQIINTICHERLEQFLKNWQDLITFWGSEIKAQGHSRLSRWQRHSSRGCSVDWLDCRNYSVYVFNRPSFKELLQDGSDPPETEPSAGNWIRCVVGLPDWQTDCCIGGGPYEIRRLCLLRI